MEEKKKMTTRRVCNVSEFTPAGNVVHNYIIQFNTKSLKNSFWHDFEIPTNQPRMKLIY